MKRSQAEPQEAAKAISSSLSAIKRKDQEIAAFAYVDEAAKPSGFGRLNGVAVGVKDVIDVTGMPTGMGASLYRGWTPMADATVVAALRRSGATVVGKTATTAFACSDPTTTRNPLDISRTPGGSSSGSAAAVAAGMVALSLGTQTAGSIIRPASYCGVPAIKPSYNLIPRIGVKCLAWSLDTIGLFASSIDDLQVGLSAMSGREASMMETARLRVAVVTQEFAGPAEIEARTALETAERCLTEAGASVVRMDLPKAFTSASLAYNTILEYEARRALAWEFDNHRDKLPPKLLDYLLRGDAATDSAYDEAQDIALSARASCGRLFDETDVLLTYSAPGVAPPGLESTGDARFNLIWTLLGVPCVNVPTRVDGTSLPTGVQIIGRHGSDQTALSGAALLERSLRNLL